MKKRLGISLYPQKSDLENDLAYIDKAKKYGFNRIFICFLSIGTNFENELEKFHKIINYANKNMFEVSVDIAPDVLDKINVDKDILNFFNDLGVSAIRLDQGYSGKEEADMTFNSHGLKVELNMSNNTFYLDNIFSHKPNYNLLTGCHNFYPQSYTGLSYQHFIDCSKKFKSYGLRTAAFVNSENGNKGPWDINDGLCTLEQHRNLPIEVQAKELWATNLIDDVIIGNAYASENELKKLSEINNIIIDLEIEVEPKNTDIEKNIMEELHVRRGDITEFLVRSTEVRKKYIDSDIQPKFVNKKNFEIGDVLIGNNNFGKYKAELQIVLKEMPYDTRRNIVGKVKTDNICLLNYINEWDKFNLK
ncbi:DUF871 domain-containing protein [Mammaliicoccus lentus]|uniref:DUF871 domain-containing protein n=1 Tax=Mammaliicoccus lentus TaxID=42858 RepID=UPI001B328699|nr:MupG family TIM beta-alpha barrel fold protein [Mammaliicoccus lentus]